MAYCTSMRTAGTLRAVWVLIGVGVACVGPSQAAEFRLRSQCTVKTAVVTLGDVAEVISADPQQASTLAAIELFPAPLATRQRFVRMREIQDLLVLRGINLVEHRFSGSNQVTVAVASNEPRPEPEISLTPAALRKANREVHDALCQYLRESAGADEPWTVEVDLSQSQGRLVAGAGSHFSIAGGTPPWTGMQRFEVVLESSAEHTRFPLEAQVSLPAAVVVAVRSLSRGALVHDTDVELQHCAARQSFAGACTSLDDVLGKEVVRAVPEGRIIEQESLRSPLVIHRGEVVTVYARCQGIQVRTAARAKDDGGLGDLIAVESIESRTSYSARVNGIREVEVLAGSIPADEKPFGSSGQVAARQPR
jgi:flagella basal body P-ring formation protein FlgA